MQRRRRNQIYKIKKTQMKKELMSSSESENFDINEICNDTVHQNYCDRDRFIQCKENNSKIKRDEDWIKCVILSLDALCMHKLRKLM